MKSRGRRKEKFTASRGYEVRPPEHTCSVLLYTPQDDWPKLRGGGSMGDFIQYKLEKMFRSRSLNEPNG
jgi:hypothetical protein